ncbi:MAG: helix-hairpin-helix domain-containing protein [Chitinophagaceae bacterium]
MDNFQIANMFSLLAKLMDIHGANSFKSKSYAIAAFQLEKATEQVAGMELKQIASLKGIGDSASKKIAEILATGELKILTDLIEATPEGVMEMLNIKGLGPKKIQTVWKEMEIESIGELLYACNENRLTLFKGFGEKTQKNIKETIEFYLRHQGSFLYAQIEKISQHLLAQLQEIVAPARVFVSGDAAMRNDTIEVIHFITDCNVEKLIKGLVEKGVAYEQDESQNILFKMEEGLRVNINCVPAERLMQTVFASNSSEEFLETFHKKHSIADLDQFATEEEYFTSVGLPPLPAYLRHHGATMELAMQKKLPRLIQVSDIKGMIHTHSNWSDGSFTIAQMAAAAIAKGFEYLVISDHSKSAFYANGLVEDRITAQHLEIDALNELLAPFRIYKSIESDILNDGSLDYSDDILESFDLVIASVHNNLKMSQEKAMQRLLAAIENPYTTILGHMTGRLLLSRNGYPVDHKAIIDACVENNVVIEINAHPRRLDIDWRWIPYAVKKGALLSIDPDAHTIDGFDDIRHGVMAAQKGLLTAADNLSSFSITDFERFLIDRRS